VPSFGEWGFILASDHAFDAPLQLPAGLRYLTENSTRNLCDFPNDMTAVPVEVHRLNNQMLVRYFEEEWAHYVH
jgi:spermidine synthase